MNATSGRGFCKRIFYTKRTTTGYKSTSVKPRLLPNWENATNRHPNWGCLSDGKWFVHIWNAIPKRPCPNFWRFRKHRPFSTVQGIGGSEQKSPRWDVAGFLYILPSCYSFSTSTSKSNDINRSMDDEPVYHIPR